MADEPDALTAITQLHERRAAERDALLSEIEDRLLDAAQYPSDDAAYLWADDVRRVITDLRGTVRVRESAIQDDVVREVFCRVLSEEYHTDLDALMAEWAEYQVGWLWWGRALGGFLAHKQAQRLGKCIGQPFSSDPAKLGHDAQIAMLTAALNRANDVLAKYARVDGYGWIDGEYHDDLSQLAREALGLPNDA